ncbi:MAG: pilus assembly protein PilP [Candidatus Binatia bacterium]
MLAQSNAPATASKALAAAKTAASTQPVSKAEKAEKPAAVAPPTDAAPAASETKADASEGLRLAPGRRDPFRPITLNVRAASTRRRENLSPLERFEIGQLKLVGVVWNVKEPTALVEDSSGLGYMVKAGTPIGSNDGKVREVRRDSLIVEEGFVDLYGAKKRREVSMRLAVEQ